MTECGKKMKKNKVKAKERDMEEIFSDDGIETRKKKKTMKSK